MPLTRTQNQQRILDLLTEVNDGISAQDLHMKLRQRGISMGLATVYRALEFLKQEGSIQVRTLPTGESLYSPTQSDTHHLTCIRCGASVAMEECPLHGLENHLSEDHQFKVFYHTLEFFGLCKTCQQSAA